MSHFVSPRTHQPLTLAPDGMALVTESGECFDVRDGIADFVGQSDADRARSADLEYYRSRAGEYDRGMDVVFRMLLCDETRFRSQMIGALRAGEGSRLLEIGCGTCRDTSHLLALGATVFAGDLSREMLEIGRLRLQDAGVDRARLQLFRGDAMQLPFADGFFDAAFHFGGLNLFPDIAGALAEMARVVRPGGRVIAGDEGVAPWLANTDFARILKNSNPLFQYTPPLDRIPVCARDVSCNWVLNGSFYVIGFEVGEGEPPLDLDVEFPGWRGGSHRTRYYGRLEGVSPELRETVVNAAAASGMSISAWLEQTLRTATAEAAAQPHQGNGSGSAGRSRRG